MGFPSGFFSSPPKTIGSTLVSYSFNSGATSLDRHWMLQSKDGEFITRLVAEHYL